MTDKAELRARLRRPRTSPTDEGPPLGAVLHELPPGPVLGFLPVGGEPDVTEVMRALAAEGRLWLPRVAEDGASLTAHPVRDLAADTAPGAFGLMEPVTPPADPAPLRSALVPGMAFDAHGRRLGRGKGFYDRLLPRMKGARRVGVASTRSLVEAVPVEVHDAALDAVVAPRVTWRHDTPRVLDGVLARADAADAVVVLDLDSTLLEAGPRHLEVLRAFAAERDDARLAAVAAEATWSSFRWRVDEPLDRAGVTDPELRAALVAQWRRRFLSRELSDVGHATPGATELMHELAGSRAQLVYLTGRDAPTMGEGTWRLLTACGFPGPDRASLWLKPDPAQDDVTWKRAAHARLRTLGRVVATLDNDTVHAHACLEAFPDAMHVLVGHARPTDAPLPLPGLMWVPDLRRSRSVRPAGT